MASIPKAFRPSWPAVAFSTQSASNRAKRIILVRHGESLGNVDEKTYVNMADWKIPLSEFGIQQAQAAGQKLATLLKGEQCFLYYSPYLRTTQTKIEIENELRKHHVHIVGQRSDSFWGERMQLTFPASPPQGMPGGSPGFDHELPPLIDYPEPRIVEQQFGNFQHYEEVKNARDQRTKFGRFFYRFPSGEAGLDVYNRVTSFISTMFRDAQQMRNAGVEMDQMNIVIVTHGLTLRLFLMRWLQLDVQDFEQLYNPDNGFLAVMERKCDESGRQWFELSEESASHLRIKKRRTDWHYSLKPLESSL